MSETLLPKKSDTSESFLQRFGLTGYYSLLVPISTSISEKGIGHAAGLDLELAEGFSERYSLGFEFDYAGTQGKLFPTAGSEGTTFDRESWALMAGMGKALRLFPYFNDAGDLAGSFALRTSSYIGGGHASIEGEERVLDGESFKPGRIESAFAASKQRYGLLYDIGLGSRGVLSIGPELEIGAHYAGKNSEFNRMNLGLMFTARIGFADAGCLPGGTIDSDLGAMGIAYGLYSMAQALGQRFMMNAALVDAQEDLEGYLSMGGEGRGSMTDLPLLQSAAALAGAGGGNLSVALRAGDWYWAFLAAQAAGAGFIASDGKAGKVAGVSDIVGALRLSGYAMAGIHKSENRLSLSRDDVRAREMYVSLASWLASAALFGIGAAAKDDITMGAGGAQAMGVSFSPGLLEDGLVESMGVSFVPASYVEGGGRSGVRSGLRIHNSWANFPHESVQLYTSVVFLSPLYGNKELNSDIGASMGLEWKTPYSRIYAGPDILSIFGGDEDTKAGIGMIIGADGIIPVADKLGIKIGGYYMLHGILPKGGIQHDAGFSIGLEFKSSK